ncbi:hypothetical protein Esti_003169 [Eimeria stiedai]
MANPRQLRTGDIVAAEVWAYSPPQEASGSFTGKRQVCKSEEEQRWRSRRELFSRFDSGIQLDDDMWWSVTPEQLAAHTAERCGCTLLLDGFAGAGGNAIAFAKTCGFVIACEIEGGRVQAAQANAAVYGRQVAARTDFILGDFATLTSRQFRRGVFDVAFLAPPWGGPSYNAREVFNLKAMGAGIVRLWQTICPSFASGLPRTVPLLPLLRAAAVFNLRSSNAENMAPRKITEKQQGCSEETFLSNRRRKRSHAIQNEKAFADPRSSPQLRIEVAVRRSRLDAGGVSFRWRETPEGLSKLANGLRRTLCDGASTIAAAAELAIQADDALPRSRRRRTGTTTTAGTMIFEEALAPIRGHHRRWETVEAEEEEASLLRMAESDPSINSVVACSVALAAPRKRVYGDGAEAFAADWRLLPVDLLWAAAPLTKGLLKDPLTRIYRRMQSAACGEGAENTCAASAGHDGLAATPAISALCALSVPCVCQEIQNWRWRSLGLTVYFGFLDEHLSSNTSSSERRSKSSSCTRASKKSSFNRQPFVSNPDLQHYEQQPSKVCSICVRQPLMEELFKEMLEAALNFSGLRDPQPLVSPAHSQAAHNAPTSEKKLGRTEGAADEAALAESEAPKTLPCAASGLACTEQASRVVCKAGLAYASPACEVVAKKSEEPPTAPWEHSSLAFFARRVVAAHSSNYPTNRCNCFYSAEWKESDLGETQQVSMWRAFSARLAAAASEKLSEARNSCCCRRCCNTQAAGAEAAGAVSEPARSVKCSWRPVVWKEVEKAVHCYLAGASGCSAHLRLAVVPLHCKGNSRRKKRIRRTPVTAAEPIDVKSLGDFLNRVEEAYASGDWFASLPPCEAASDAEASLSSETQECTEAYQSPAEAESGCSEGQVDNSLSFLWTEEEVLHWHFACSMWRNSGLRVLVAQHLRPLFDSPVCVHDTY